jgi:hypothetical protein
VKRILTTKYKTYLKAINPITGEIHNPSIMGDTYTHFNITKECHSIRAVCAKSYPRFSFPSTRINILDCMGCPLEKKILTILKTSSKLDFFGRHH